VNVAEDIAKSPSPSKPAAKTMARVVSLLTRSGFIGTGIGLRYSTPIGPLRADVGVPLDRRSDVDDHLQIYVSIGQAY